MPENELRRLEGLLISVKNDETQLPVSEEICRRIKTAWNAAMFSDMPDAVLRRYFNFHLKGISAMLDALSPESPPVITNALAGLSGHLREYYADYTDEGQRAPAALIVRWQERLRIPAGKLAAKLNAAVADQLFRDSVRDVLQMTEDADEPEFSFRAMDYCEYFIRSLSAADFESPLIEQILHGKLLLVNFNHLGYLAARKEAFRRTLAGLPAACRSAFLKEQEIQVQTRSGDRRYIYHPGWPPLAQMLTEIFGEETAMITETPPAREKVSLTLSVPQLACLLYLFYEEGLFGPVVLSDIFRKTANGFRSKRQPDISPGSLSKEFYGITQVTAAFVRDKLQQMLSRINANFFPVWFAAGVIISALLKTR